MPVVAQPAGTKLAQHRFQKVVARPFCLCDERRIVHIRASKQQPLLCAGRRPPIQYQTGGLSTLLQNFGHQILEHPLAEMPGPAPPHLVDEVERRARGDVDEVLGSIAPERGDSPLVGRQGPPASKPRGEASQAELVE